MARYEIPISDPTPHLGPTATRLLEAAKTVVLRDGFRGLTFERIAAEAGENAALIRYHFGSKAGLIATLVDAVLYQECIELIERLAALPPGEERRRALFRLHESYAHDLGSYRLFYELIPHVLREDQLRPHLRDLMDWYRKLDAWALGAGEGVTPPPGLEPLALLTVALADGVALQVQADPELDIAPAFILWQRMVFGYLEGRRTAGGAS